VSDDAAVRDLLARVRAGDPAAARELVDAYGPAVRRFARYRLGPPGRSPAVDSADVCQSVLASFLLRAAAGGYDALSVADLVHLLLGIARNKVRHWNRHETAARRDRGRTEPLPADAELACGRTPPPDRVEFEDLLAEAYRRLTPDEARLTDLRRQGRSWEEIGRDLDASPATLRKQHSRALGRIARELGLEPGDA
jgi:RNA polymerase sigma factor (sigma-70 family)